MAHLGKKSCMSVIADQVLIEYPFVMHLTRMIGKMKEP